MKSENETSYMMPKEKNGNGGKNLFMPPQAAKRAWGLFLFSFFEPKCSLKAITRLAANVEAFTQVGI